MYDIISEALSDTYSQTSTESLEEAYESLYRQVSRLQDMTDFSAELLKDVYRDSSTMSFIEAFKKAINEKYEFQEFEYFGNTIKNNEEKLQEILKKAVNSKDIEQTWSNEIEWLYTHLEIDYEGRSYTIDQLRSKIEGGM